MDDSVVRFMVFVSGDKYIRVQGTSKNDCHHSRDEYRQCEGANPTSKCKSPAVLSLSKTWNHSKQSHCVGSSILNFWYPGDGHDDNWEMCKQTPLCKQTVLDLLRIINYRGYERTRVIGIFPKVCLCKGLSHQQKERMGWKNSSELDIRETE